MMQGVVLSPDQMAAVLDNAPVAMYVSALDDYELLYANRLARELLLRSGIVGKTTCYGAAGFDRPCPFCRIGEMREDELCVREFRLPSTGRVYQLSGKVILWGRRRAHIEYILDITDQKREEARVRAVTEELETTFSSVPCGLCGYRYDGRTIAPVFHNPAFYEIMGYSDEHIANMEQETTFLGVNPDDLPALAQKIAETIRTGRVMRHIYRVFNDKKGEYRWIQLDGSVKAQEDGSKLLYAVYTDVSERVRLEKELAESSEKMQDIINAIPGGVAIYKISDRFETIYFSDGVPEITGYTVEEYRELCRGDAVQMTHPADTEMVVRRVNEALQNHTVADFEFRKLHRDGHTVWVHVLAKQTGEQDGCPLLHCVFHNITDLKETQKEMVRLEQYFQTIVSNLPGGVAVVRLSAKQHYLTEYLSEGFGALLGMTAEQAQQRYGNDVLGCIHPDDAPRVSRLIREFVAGKDDFLELRGRLKRADGSAIWIKCRLSIAREETGAKRIYATCNDVTREMEDQERIRQQYKELLLQHYRSPGPNTLIVGHCNVTQSRIEEIIDFTGSDLLNNLGNERNAFFTGISELIPDPAERQAFLDRYLNEPALAAFRRGESEQRLKCFMRMPREKRGRYVQITVHLVAEPDTGDVTGILTVMDVTDQVISDRILRGLSLTGYDLVADVDVQEDSFTALAFTQSADAWPKRHCYSDAVRHFGEVYVVREDREAFFGMLKRDHIMDRLAREGPYSFTYATVSSGTGKRIKRITISAADLSLGRVCLARADVTDMLRAERQAKDELEQALALAKEASRAKSDFLSAMSHDIRTPMNAIMGMTTLATAHFGDSERVWDCLSKIAISSKHLLSLINDVLDMSKIESGKVTLGSTQILLPELVEQLFAILQPQAETGGLTLERHMGPLDHPCFYGDALRLNQVLINILGNAVKFTPRGGTVRFTVDELPENKGAGWARYRFTMQDNGCGMSEEFLAHLFEPFTRSRESVSGRMEGTGLGLSITKGLIDLMGGDIRVTSRVDEGTTFFVTLDFRSCEMADCADTMNGQPYSAGAETGDAAFAGRHFLVAEDNAINAEILGALLELHGARSTVAVDGRRAVQAFLSAAPGTYDAILMDVQMPELNGYEATRAIRAADRLDAPTIPIVAMTANAFSEDVQAALAAGMDAHVAKPIDMKLLRDALEKLLSDK